MTLVKAGGSRFAWGFLVGVVVYAESLAGSVHAARPPAAKLLPQNTVLFVYAPSAADLLQRFLRTTLGQMGQDGQVQPFVKHFYASLAAGAANLEQQTGLTLSELLSIPQGELALAVVPEGGSPAAVLLCDAGGQVAKARQLLQWAGDALEKSGSEKTEESVSGTVLVTYQSGGERQRTVSFFERDSTVVIGTGREAVRQVLGAWDKKAGATLADNDKFAAILRSSREAPDQEPPLVWYVDPIPLMRSAGQNNPQMQLAVALLPALGLDGVLGVGGSYIPDAGGFDSVMHVHVLLNTPRAGLLEMIALGSGDTTPEPWVPADVASYTTFYWRVGPSFKRLTSLFDSFRGEGALSRELKRRFQDPIGLDVEKDLLPLLEGRVTLLVWVERPVSLGSRKTLLALRVNDPVAAGRLLDRLAEKNREKMVRQSHAGRLYYEIPLPRRGAEALESPQTPTAPAPPKPCVGVVGDYLVLSDQVLYRKVLAQSAEPTNSLADALDFKLIASRIRRRSGGARPAMISFARREENLRYLYELAQTESGREGLRKASQRNWLFRAIDAALEANRLPPFESLARYYAPSGAMLLDDGTSLHYTAFSLRRK